jgi:hypothetical protein
MRGEGGQATVEWVALVLLAALVLGAAAALAGREDGRGLGEAVAKRIASGPEALGPSRGAPDTLGLGRRRAAPAPAAGRPSPAPPRGAAAPPPASTPGAVQAFRSLRGLEEVAKHTWIVCLGYKRWRYELENPMAPNEVLPVRDALGILNGCLNPYDFLLED